jgi:predicted Zn-dependent protease
MKMLRTALLCGLMCGVVGIGVAGGCVKNSATGKSIFTMGMSRSAQIALGAEAAPQFTQEFGGPIPNSQLQEYVKDIGVRMAAQTEAENPSLPWEFTLLNTPVVNAFALPGGKVFFTRGLAERLTSEAQMAGVIGHEIGHVTAEHGAQRISSQIAFNVGLGVAAVIAGTSKDDRVKDIAAIGIPALAIGGNLVLLKFGRDEELEADRLGVRYMSKVGYNPIGQKEVMEVLGSLNKGQAPPAIFSTHPNPADRVRQVERMLEGDYAFTQGNTNYGEFRERYQSQFLSVVKGLPPSPAPKKSARWIEMSDEQFAAHGVKIHRLADGLRAFDVDDPTTWCATCMAIDLQEPINAEHAKASPTAAGMLRIAVLSNEAER